VGGFETVVLLLKKGANVDAQDRNGMSALHLASRNGLVPVCMHTCSVCVLLMHCVGV